MITSIMQQHFYWPGYFVVYQLKILFFWMMLNFLWFMVEIKFLLDNSRYFLEKQNYIWLNKTVIKKKMFRLIN